MVLLSVEFWRKRAMVVRRSRGMSVREGDSGERRRMGDLVLGLVLHVCGGSWLVSMSHRQGVRQGQQIGSVQRVQGVRVRLH